MNMLELMRVCVLCVLVMFHLTRNCFRFLVCIYDCLFCDVFRIRFDLDWFRLC